MHQPQYVRTPEGVRFQDTSGRLGLPLQSGLALVYDRLEGVLLKHGDSAAVDTYFRRLVTELAGTTLPADIEMLVVDLKALTPAFLVEINRAVQVSGYVATLAQHLASRPSADEEPRNA